MMMKASYLILLVILLNVSVFAKPSLKNQSKWSNKQKDEFIKYALQGSPSPSSKKIKVLKENSTHSDQSTTWSGDSGKFMSLSYHGGYTFAEDPLDYSQYEHGATLLAGDHLFSWVRIASGIRYFKVNGQINNRVDYSLNKLVVPFQGELALIPLGFPHTEYLLLKVGIAINYLWANQEGEELLRDVTQVKYDPSLGFSSEWLTSIGYEWQLGENFWRIHLTLDAHFPLKSLSSNSVSLYSSLGTSYVF